MIEIDLANATWAHNTRGTQFLPLGSVARSDVPVSLNAQRRIDREVAGPQPDIWGTLGAWRDDDARAFKGRLRISERGDEHSVVEQSGDATIQLINDIKGGLLPGLDSSRVRERFIDLSELWFDRFAGRTFALDQVFALRLTVFVRPGEGALVVLQHGRLGGGGVEFIQPEPTGPDFSCSARDRLTYRIPLPLDAPIDKASTVAGDVKVTLRENATRIAAQTSIKILTYQRGNSTSAEVVARALRALGRDKYQLHKWDVNEGCFTPAAPAQVRRDVKTLLLLHGTFSSTRASFGPLAQEGTFSWLENMAIAQRRYGQILSFDHETVFDGLVENTAQLLQATGGGLLAPVDVVSHSRGGLLTKHLAIRAQGMQVERAVLVACANGVGYFRVARGLSRMLSVLYRLSRLSTIGSAIVALAQHSIDAVLSFNGLKVMIPGSKELASVMTTAVPRGRVQTRYLPIPGDYDRALVSEDGFFKRLGASGLDLVLKAILGGQHDWVVGTKNQGILAQGAGLPNYTPKLVQTIHTSYFGKPQVRATIQSYLLNGKV